MGENMIPILVGKDLLGFYTVRDIAKVVNPAAKVTKAGALNRATRNQGQKKVSLSVFMCYFCDSRFAGLGRGP